MSAKLHRLSNGLTVALDPMAEVETVSVGLYADVGSRSEPEGLSGLAHMVEHMVFKGAGPRDARAIAEDVEDVGGSLNAWTARDHTVFHARLLKDDLPLGVDIIADFVRAAHLDEAELEREKGVVLAELGEARDTPDDIIFDHLSRAAFANQPLGLPVLGDEESIAAIDRGALVAWIEQQYRPSRLVIAAAGKCDEDALLKQVEARFGDLAAVVPEKPARALFTGGTHHDRRRFDQLHLAQAWDAPGFHAKTVHAAGLFSSIAGGGMSSRLFQEVREERGLAYSVYSWTQPLADTGIFGVYCASTRDQAGDAHRLIGEVLARTAAELTEAELARARAQAKAGLLMGLEAVTARADHLARQIQIFGRIVPPEETVALIDAVTIDEARTVGQAMLAGPSALATVGGKLKAAA